MRSAEVRRSEVPPTSGLRSCEVRSPQCRSATVFGKISGPLARGPCPALWALGACEPMPLSVSLRRAPQTFRAFA